MADVQQFPVPPEARQPRGLVRVSGQVMPGWVSFEVDNNTFYQADTFRVTFAASNLPAAYGVNWWAEQAEIFVELFAGFPARPENFTAADLDRLIYGRVDHIEYDPVSGELVATGRDLTSHFIDTKTTEEWRNQTASTIATTLAARHGLTPVVTATTAKVGGYYDIDHVLVTNQHSEWDLLSYLATNEEFVVYVRGQELHFEPRPDPTKATPYLLRWKAPTAADPVAALNGQSLRFQHDLTVAKGVVVWVQAMNSKTGKPMTVAYPVNKAKGTKPGQSSPHSQVYTVRMRKKPMTPEEALRKAQEVHRTITQHEMKLQWELPADGVLSVTNVIQASGTGSAFDQTYYPDTITRHMSAESGYTMNVSAKNIAHMNEGVL